MVDFKLGKEIKIFFFVLPRAWDKEKMLSPHEESHLRPSVSALRCSTADPQRLDGERGLLPSISLFLYRAQNFPSLLFYLQT